MIYQVKLEKGEIWKPSKVTSDSALVHRGIAWVTYQGLPTDFVMTAGDAFPCLSRGMLIEALEDLVLEFRSEAHMIAP